MNKRLVLITALGAALSAASLLPIPASAHNAAYMVLANGKCLEVGAGNEVSLPASANAPSNGGFLDLIPGPGDQFGARFAADQGDTPLLGGHRCP